MGHPPEPAIHLTPRELEVLVSVCAGHSSKKIGLELGIRPHTVEAYINHMRMKMDATNRCHMVAIAVRRGLYHDDDPPK
jgi:DNA-binding CsgD family transcriptional regulator